MPLRGAAAGALDGGRQVLLPGGAEDLRCWEPPFPSVYDIRDVSGKGGEHQRPHSRAGQLGHGIAGVGPRYIKALLSAQLVQLVPAGKKVIWQILAQHRRGL
jgi:hypothetical protein